MGTGPLQMCNTIFVSYEDFAMWQIYRAKQNKASDGSRTRTKSPSVAEITIALWATSPTDCKAHSVFYGDFAMWVIYRAKRNKAKPSEMFTE